MQKELKATPYLYLIICLCVLLSWSNSFSVPFLLDDNESILTNTTLSDFFSFHWLSPPSTSGETVSGRPVLNGTFALNHALHQHALWGYHAVNVLIHLLNSLLLFGILERSIHLFEKRNEQSSGNKRYLLSGIITLFWALHPLQTETVTYIAQRAESLGSLFYLLSVFAFIRFSESEKPSRFWGIVCILACYIGIGAKELIVTVPVFILLWDRTFVSGTFRSCWEKHKILHIALFASWIPLGFLIGSNHSRGGSIGWIDNVGIWESLLTQSKAICLYLQQTIWPNQLVFDYGTRFVSGFHEVFVQFILLLVAFVVSLWLCMKNKLAGFLCFSFFLVLAPTSSIIPIHTQPIAEHRMYLALIFPLSALIILLNKIVPQKGKPWLWSLFVIAVVTLGTLTHQRNVTYQTRVALWKDTVTKNPDNARARNNYGQALIQEGQLTEAKKQLLEAIKIQPNHAFARFSLATLQAHEGSLNEAIENYRLTLQVAPDYHEARLRLAETLLKAGKDSIAVKEYLEYIKQQPQSAEAYYALGNIYAQNRQIALAANAFKKVVSIDPSHTGGWNNLGNCQLVTRQFRAAIQSYKKVLELMPNNQMALENLQIAQEYADR